MGLTLVVGQLSQLLSEGEDIEPFQEMFASLNEVLAEMVLPPHSEPLNLEPSRTFEAQMWGYGGLHAVRRLAAYQALEGRLPQQAAYESYSTDPLVERLNQQLGREYNGRRGGPIRRWLTARRPQSKFEHLLWHSDCEGIYLPTDFEHVIMDYSQPQRAGLGGMVGSSVRLLEECNELARAICLPDRLHEQSDELWEHAESPSQEGEPWQILGVEAFGLVCLIHACRASIESGAALVFN